MDQPVPRVNDKDVKRIMRRDFPAAQFEDVMAVLDEYGMENWQREAPRVKLAALKLAHGDLDALRREIEVAKRDYRDVVAYAEYPEYMQSVSPSNSLSPKQVQAIIDRDWLQYNRWLNE